MGEFGELPEQMPVELIGRRGMAAAKDNAGERSFDPFHVGNGDHGSLGNRRMGHQDRTDPFPPLLMRSFVRSQIRR